MLVRQRNISILLAPAAVLALTACSASKSLRTGFQKEQTSAEGAGDDASVAILVSDEGSVDEDFVPAQDSAPISGTNLLSAARTMSAVQIIPKADGTYETLDLGQSEFTGDETSAAIPANAYVLITVGDRRALVTPVALGGGVGAVISAASTASADIVLEALNLPAAVQLAYEGTLETTGADEIAVLASRAAHFTAGLRASSPYTEIARNWIDTNKSNNDGLGQRGATAAVIASVQTSAAGQTRAHEKVIGLFRANDFSLRRTVLEQANVRTQGLESAVPGATGGAPRIGRQVMNNIATADADGAQLDRYAALVNEYLLAQILDDMPETKAAGREAAVAARDALRRSMVTLSSSDRRQMIVDETIPAGTVADIKAAFDAAGANAANVKSAAVAAHDVLDGLGVPRSNQDDDSDM